MAARRRQRGLAGPDAGVLARHRAREAAACGAPVHAPRPLLPGARRRCRHRPPGLARRRSGRAARRRVAASPPGSHGREPRRRRVSVSGTQRARQARLPCRSAAGARLPVCVWAAWSLRPPVSEAGAGDNCPTSVRGFLETRLRQRRADDVRSRWRRLGWAR